MPEALSCEGIAALRGLAAFGLLAGGVWVASLLGVADARAEDGLWSSAGTTGTSAADAAAAPLPEGWILTIGANMGLAPLYDGARTSGLAFSPNFDLRRVGEPADFSAPDDNFGVALFDFDGVRIGPVGAIREGRPFGELPGLPGYPWALEAGGFVEYWPIAGVLRTRAELMESLGNSGGMSANLAADVVQKNGAYTWAIGPRATLADQATMQMEFGLPPAAAALTGRLRPYDADAGFKSAGVASSLSYDWSQEWTTTVFGSYQRLVGAAASSPVTTLSGSPNQFSLGVGFERSFVLGAP